MTLVQHPQAGIASPLDTVDLLVPPPRPWWWAAVRAVVVVAVIAAALWIWASGLAVPKLGPDGQSGSSWSLGQASRTSGPQLVFMVRNNGSVPLTVDGVDARAPGLISPQVTVSTGGITVPAGRPVPLAPGAVLVVGMHFASVDCRAIEVGGSDTVPFHLRSPLGVHTTTSLVPGLLFDRPGSPIQVGTVDPNRIGWAAGITWTACHPGSSTPSMSP